MDLVLASLPKYLADESEAWKLLESLRWHGTPECPHCGTVSADHYFIASRSGTRTTAKGHTSYRRLWKCQNKTCRKQFSVLVGTIFESSKIPVSKWLLAIWLMNAGKNGVSALELQRQLGIGSYQTAWFMNHRIREAMRREPLASLLTGTVVADETFVGGKPKNKHQQGRGPYLPGGGRGRAGHASVTSGQKVPVLALVEKDSGEVRTRVITDVTGKTLRKAIQEQVDMPNTVLHSDGWAPYIQVAKGMKGHESVDHSSYEFVRGNVTTNQAESFFAQFKRSLDGTYHNVSKVHLHRFATEFEYRWNTRGMTDSRRVQTLIDNTRGRRLSYRPLTER
jgi:transposase-like protein